MSPCKANSNPGCTAAQVCANGTPWDAFDANNPLINCVTIGPTKTLGLWIHSKNAANGKQANIFLQQHTGAVDASTCQVTMEDTNTVNILVHVGINSGNRICGDGSGIDPTQNIDPKTFGKQGGNNGGNTNGNNGGKAVCKPDPKDKDCSLCKDGAISYRFCLSKPKLSGGSIFLIIFFVTLAVYLIAGVAYMRIRHEAEGADLIPNREFWADLPVLVKDGVVFSLAKVSGGRICSDGGYENVG